MKAYHLGEQMSDEDSLAHYGVKGMKWGVRKPREDGVSRSRGRIIDRNEKAAERIGEARTALKEGGGSLSIRFANRVNRMTMGKRMTEKYYDTALSNLNDQSDRMRKGELTLHDRLDVVMSHPATRVAGAVLARSGR
jgi:hypothetical protein